MADSVIAGDTTGTAGASSSSAGVASPSTQSTASGTIPSSTTSPETAAAPTSLREALEQGADPTRPAESSDGPIPLARHRSAIENARTAAVAEAQAKWKESFGWAESITPEDRALLQERTTNPVAVIQRVIADANKNPQTQQMIRSYVAQVLGNRAPATNGNGTQAPAQNTATDDPRPVPEYIEHQGQRWPTLDYQTKLAEWQGRDTQRQLDKALAPFMAERQTREQAERAQAEERQVTESNDKTYKAVSALPHFQEHRADIAKRMNELALANPPSSHADIATLARDAYLQVVMPKQEESLRKSILAGLDAKARVGSVVPGDNGRAPSITERPISLSQALRENAASASR